jgi:purine nucleosidase
VLEIPNVRRIIFDCDPGVDDALAFILALKSKCVDISGMTTVSGNVPVDQTTLNACRVLDYFNANIPVARGASKPLRALPVYAKSIHGNDGLEDSPLLPRSSTRKLESKNAIDFIIQLVESGVRTIVATGPLTNIALAFQKNNKIMNTLEELIIMGGAIRIPGNIDSLSEFNFYVDPDAADYVLQKTEVPKVLVPLDVTHRVILTPADLADIGNTSSTGKLLKSIIPKFQKAYIDTGFAGCPLHDPLAMSFCIDPTFLKFRPLYVRVETSGSYTRGVCVPEERPWIHKQPNVSLASEVDSDRFLEYFKGIVR